MNAAKRLARLWRGIPILQQKAAAAFTAHYGKAQSSLASGESEKLTSLFTDRVKLETMLVHGFVLNLIKSLLSGKRVALVF